MGLIVMVSGRFTGDCGVAFAPRCCYSHGVTVMTQAQFEKWHEEVVRVLASRGARSSSDLQEAIAGRRKNVRIRRAASLLVTLASEKYKVQNFVTRQAFACRRGCLDLLANLEDWTDVALLAARFPGEPVDRLARDLGRLAELGAIVVEGSEYADFDEAYRTKWEWGEVAGLFHFGIKDVRYAIEEEMPGWIADRAAQRPSPALYQTNETCAYTKPLPSPQLAAGVFRTMRARRSRREFSKAAISLEALTRIVHSGLGITSFSEGLFGTLPLKMTPSGGARNPYEGFVLVLNVADLQPAIYHYSALDNSLGLVREGALPPPSSFLGNLEWINNAAAVILLVANFPRTAWKYPNPVAYRVVLLEAGHIAQNMLLAATDLDVAATPIAAIADSIAESALELDPIRQGVVHAVVLGQPLESDS